MPTFCQYFISPSPFHRYLFYLPLNDCLVKGNLMSRVEDGDSPSSCVPPSVAVHMKPKSRSTFRQSKYSSVFFIHCPRQHLFGGTESHHQSNFIFASCTLAINTAPCEYCCLWHRDWWQNTALKTGFHTGVNMAVHSDYFLPAQTYN
jgi:hypothetical protein